MSNFDTNIFGRKLKALRKSSGLSQSEFINKLSLEVQQAAYSSWELGNSIPSLIVVKKIADYFNVSVDWLLDSSGTYDSEPKYTNLSNIVSDKLTPINFKKVPIISKVQGGDPKLIYREDNIDGHALLPEGIIADYALVVEGESMYNPTSTNSIAPGDTVFCSTSETPLIGDIVVILTTEGRQMIKRYFKYYGVEKLEFSSFNREYPPMFLDSNQIEVMHRVVYHQPQGRKM